MLVVLLIIGAVVGAEFMKSRLRPVAQTVTAAPAPKQNMPNPRMPLLVAETQPITEAAYNQQPGTIYVPAFGAVDDVATCGEYERTWGLM